MCWAMEHFLPRSGETTTYTDITVQPNTTYDYRVVPCDRAGNTSVSSGRVTITTRSFVLFANDFESGTLGNWSGVSGLTLTTSSPDSGSYAAQALSVSGTTASAIAILPSSADKLFIRVRLFGASQGANTVHLLKVRTSTGRSLGEVYLSSTGRLGYRNDITGQSTTTTPAVTPERWHTLEVHIVVGTSRLVEPSLDGARIATINGNLGTSLIGRFQLGRNSTGRTFDVRFNEVIVDAQPITG